MGTARRYRYPRTVLRRAIYALLGIVLVLILGTFGFHVIEGMNYVDSFYFESMLATGQGPPLPLATDAGKIFASIMGFVSVGSVVTTLVFTLGPIFSNLWREGLERVEEEARTLEKDLTHSDGKALEKKDKPRSEASQ